MKSNDKTNSDAQPNLSDNRSSSESSTARDIPRRYQKMHQDYPELMQAYEALGEATRTTGPLTPREVALVKLAISVGAGLEGAAHSHCRKALDAGCTDDDLRQVALLATPTIGFPTMMRAKGWVEDVIAKRQRSST